MASPLIVKAMPLANGRFIGIALWLHRSWPPGEVVLELDDAVVPGSGAPFDRLTAAGETPLFAPLVGKRSLREAFFDWLALDPGVRRVAP